MYTIIEVIEEDCCRMKQRVDILCDTVDDLPTIEEVEKTGFDVGSFAYIANERTYKVLNNAKEWV